MKEPTYLPDQLKKYAERLCFLKKSKSFVFNEIEEWNMIVSTDSIGICCISSFSSSTPLNANVFSSLFNSPGLNI